MLLVAEIVLPSRKPGLTVQKTGGRPPRYTCTSKVFSSCSCCIKFYGQLPFQSRVVKCVFLNNTPLPLLVWWAEKPCFQCLSFHLLTPWSLKGAGIRWEVEGTLPHKFNLGKKLAFSYLTRWIVHYGHCSRYFNFNVMCLYCISAWWKAFFLWNLKVILASCPARQMNK